MYIQQNFIHSIVDDIFIVLTGTIIKKWTTLYISLNVHAYMFLKNLIDIKLYLSAMFLRFSRVLLAICFHIIVVKF